MILGGWILSGCATAPSKEEFLSLQERAQLLEQSLQEIRKHLNRLDDRMEVALGTVSAFRSDLDRVQQQVEALEQEVQHLKKPAPKPRKKARKRPPASQPAKPSPSESPAPAPAPSQPKTSLHALETPESSPSPGSSLPKTKAPPLPPERERQIQSLYQEGLSRFRKGEWTKARSLFQKVLEKAPSHDLADNALYWIGETFYSQRRFAEARRTFQKVLDLYPEGNKVADAHLKLALTYLGEGRREEGRAELERVIALYPGEEVAEKAQRALERLIREEGG